MIMKLVVLLAIGAGALRAPATAPRRSIVARARAGSDAGAGVARGPFLSAAAAAAVAAASPACASVAEPTASLVGSNVDKGLGRILLQIERLNVDCNNSGERRLLRPILTISGGSASVSCALEAEEGKDFIQYIWLKNEEKDAIVAAQEFKATQRGAPTLRTPVKSGSTYTPCAYSSLNGLWIGRSETA